MKILIMGAGAVGGCLGALLAKSGQNVTLVARGENLESIRKNGLLLKHGEEDMVRQNLVATDNPDDLIPSDLVLVCIKAYQTDQAMEVMRKAISANTIIITLQNGIGSQQKLIEKFGVEKVLQGVIYVEAEQLSPGVVTFHGDHPRIIFGGENGVDSSKMTAIEDVLNHSKINASISNDIQRDAWHKLIFISALSGLTCVTRGTFAEVMNNSKTVELVHNVLEEAALVARTLGVNIKPTIVEDTLEELTANSEYLVSSMYADLQNEKPLEIDVITGVISNIAKQLRVDTPINDYIFACLSIHDKRARESYCF
jgi:2-dehydropantoate 2-reductase